MRLRGVNDGLADGLEGGNGVVEEDGVVGVGDREELEGYGVLEDHGGKRGGGTGGLGL